jgi:uncharacterized membrane-anchored protein YhcB (DUF1043 family)
MHTVLIAVLSNLGVFLLKYLIAWGERSIAKQQEIKRKMEEHKANIESAKKKAEAYEQNPTSDNRNDVP